MFAGKGWAAFLSLPAKASQDYSIIQVLISRQFSHKNGCFLHDKPRLSTFQPDLVWLKRLPPMITLYRSTVLRFSMIFSGASAYTHTQDLESSEALLSAAEWTKA